MRILVMQTAFLGDVVLALPVVQRLKQLYPAAEVHMLVRRGNESLLVGHPDIARVWVWDKRRKWRSLWENVRGLRGQKFDAVLNLQRFFTSGLMALLAGGRQTVGFDKNPLSLFYSMRFPHVLGQPTDIHYWHEVDRNLTLLTALTGRPYELKDRQRPRLYPSEADRTKVQRYTDAPYVVVAPASVWYTKQWHPDQWRKMIAALPSHLKVWLVGAPNERTLCAQIAEGLPQCGNLAGELSLLQTAALMAGAVRVFANDSAPLHLASSQNAPTTAVYCSTVPQFGFGPLADDAVVMEVSGLACRPCGLHGHRACPQGHFDCALKLDPAVVAKTATAR